MSLVLDGELGALPRTLAELARGGERGLHSGGQIYVELRGSVVADTAFGFARPGEPMRRTHRMLWLSASKPWTAVAVAQLWERDRLGLDDPVAQHIPEFAQGGKEAVTIRHLLTHTSGIRMLETGWPDSSWEEIVARICARRLEPGWVPGRKAGYHLTSSWFVLGELVRRLDGRPIERYLHEELFAPLGASASGLGLREEAGADETAAVAPLFDTSGKAPAALRWTEPRWLGRPSPGANGCGPVRELARLYRLLLAGGEIGGQRLLGTQTVEAMVARHRVGLVDQTFRSRLDWGLGVIVNSTHYGAPDVPYGYGPHAGPRTFGHSGARSSVAFCDPDAGLVVALAVNGLAADETHRRRFDDLLAALYTDLGLGPG